MAATGSTESEDSYRQTSHTKLKRYPQRGAYDKDTVHAILDEAFLCHIGYMIDDQPFVLPNAYGRIDDKLYFHGSITNRTFKALKAGTKVCVTVTLLDGLVLARSGFHHSANSRSVVALGVAEAVTDPEEKVKALDAIVNHIIPGRADDLAEVRPPTQTELNSTLVLSLTLDEVSAKVRTGPGSDDDKDMSLPIWAGVIPFQSYVPGPAIPDAQLASSIQAPAYVSEYKRPGKGVKAGEGTAGGLLQGVMKRLHLV